MAETGAALPQAWYAQPALVVARALLGQVLVRRLDDGTLLSGRIVETEAYTPEDPACHAHRGETARARSMFQSGGISYVYRIYGIYHCLNAVTQAAGEGAAVLIRALEPLEGLARMLEERGTGLPRDVTRGPGRLCQALAIDRRLDGLALDADGPLGIHAGADVPDSAVRQTPRIGINVMLEAREAPWRFVIADSPMLSGSRAFNRGQAYLPTPDWFRR